MANDKIILKAEDLDGYLTNEDLNDLKHMDELFKETMKSFEPKNEEKIYISRQYVPILKEKLGIGGK